LEKEENLGSWEKGVRRMQGLLVLGPAKSFHFLDVALKTEERRKVRELFFC